MQIAYDQSTRWQREASANVPHKRFSAIYTKKRNKRNITTLKRRPVGALHFTRVRIGFYYYDYDYGACYGKMEKGRPHPFSFGQYKGYAQRVSR